MQDDPRLGRFAELLAESPHNLLSRAERANAGAHIDEAVAVAALLNPAKGSRWLDLGTGGGLPGLVLAAVFPDVRWVLVDATQKKIAAVHSFAAELGLHNVAAVAGRAEDLAVDADHRGRYAGVTARAVAGLPTLLELARGFLAPDGLLVAIKGPAWRAEMDAAGAALRLLSYVPEGTTVVETAVRPTTVVTMRAVGPPPDGFPRRSGIPRSHPLGERDP